MYQIYGSYMKIYFMNVKMCKSHSKQLGAYLMTCSDQTELIQSYEYMVTLVNLTRIQKTLQELSGR